MASYIYAAIYIYEYLNPLYICDFLKDSTIVTIVVNAKLMLPMHAIPAAISCMLISVTTE